MRLELNGSVKNLQDEKKNKVKKFDSPKKNSPKKIKQQ